MIYLDNAATGGFKPDCVKNAVLAALKICADPAGQSHSLSLALSERVFACREALSELFSGYGAERVVFTKNATEALNIALLGTLETGDHIITTVLEHSSVLRPLAALAKKGVTHSVAPLKDGVLRPEDVASLVTPKTRLVAVTAASHVTGECPDLKAIRTLLPERVLLLVDGAQGAGRLPLSMRDTGIDALALSGHKGMHAIQGAGALLLSERMTPHPLLFGGSDEDAARYPNCLEYGTLSYPAVLSLFEGALIVKAHRAEHAGRLTLLTQSLLESLAKLPRYTVYSKPNACGIAAFRHESIPAKELAELLSRRFNIGVNGGLNCAPLTHRALGTYPDGLVRASFSPFQHMREVHALVSALRDL